MPLEPHTTKTDMNDVILTLPILVAMLLGALLGALLTYLWSRSRLAEHAQAHQQDLRSLEAQHQQGKELALAAAHQRHEVALQESKEHELSVMVYPFVNTEKDDGWINKNTLVEVGYKYQLLVKGLPCFPPHVEVSESFTQKEINQQTVELLKEKAEQLAQAAANVASAGKLGGIVKVGRAAVGMRASRNKQ
jgi:hypothetical protein